MECSKAIELMPEYVFDTLSEAARAQVDAHLAGGCGGCRRELDELKFANTAWAESLAPVAPRPELKQELLERISNEKVAPAPGGTSAPATVQQRSYFPYVAASLAAIAAGSLLANASQRWGEEVIQATGSPASALWQQNVAAAEKVFGVPRAQLTSFARNAASEKLKVAIFHDMLAEQLQVVISNINPPSENKSLWLWLLDQEGGVVSAGTLKYLGDARAAGILDLAESPKNVVEAVISSEAAGQPDKPSGEKVGRARLERTS
ncbi:MAG: anti-sigma factor domain-containing protein [Bythopirellula sp.]